MIKRYQMQTKLIVVVVLYGVDTSKIRMIIKMRPILITLDDTKSLQSFSLLAVCCYGCSCPFQHLTFCLTIFLLLITDKK